MTGNMDLIRKKDLAGMIGDTIGVDKSGKMCAGRLVLNESGSRFFIRKEINGSFGGDSYVNPGDMVKVFNAKDSDLLGWYRFSDK